MSETGLSRRELVQRIGGTAAAFSFLSVAAPGVATAAAAAAATTDAGERGGGRVRRLLAQLTLDEKLSLVHGATDPERLGQAGYLPGVPRLGIPELRLSDGPAGVNVARSATGLPPVSTLGATFNVELAREYGALMGREGRALGMDVLLAPQIELSRSPLWSRNKDQSGEDPLVNALIGAAQVRGAQTQGLLTQGKHFIANNQSLGQSGDFGTGKGAFDFRVDDRTLHEVYLPAWEAVVRAGIASVMAAYNHINGKWNSENADTLTGLLRGELKFEGFATSDWGATHSTAALIAGLDVQMPDGSYFGEPLKAALLNGSIPMTALDTAVGRLLGQYDTFGMLDGSRKRAPRSVDVEAGAKVAQQVAAQGAVLLVNKGALPLGSRALEDLAVIGPTGAQVAVSVSGERAYGFEERMVGPLDALRHRAGRRARIGFAVGVDLTGTAVPASAFPGGLSGAPNVDFTGRRALPVGSSHTWTGSFVPPESGAFALKIQGWGASVALELDGKQLVSAATSRDSFVRKWSSIVPTTDGLDNGQVTVPLTGGKTYALKVTATGWSAAVGERTPVQVRFAWVTPEQRAANVRAAAELARKAHTPVVFAYNGAGGSFGGAAETGSLALPDGQDELIGAVAAVNPRTVVVLNVGNPVEMPWLDKVAAVLHSGYTGQEGGWATADLLLGKVSPGGRLVMTWPKRLADHPVHDPAHPERYQGVAEVVSYSEGVFGGYRGFDKAGIEPLFPFGHGLSYTRFSYDRLRVSGGEVTFTVTNRGHVAGAEVPQVYLGAPRRSPVELPVNALVGFERVELRPGESRRVTVRISERQLSYWDAGRRSWARVHGDRPVRVGASSRDLRLEGKVG